MRGGKVRHTALSHILNVIYFVKTNQDAREEGLSHGRRHAGEASLELLIVKSA